MLTGNNPSRVAIQTGASNFSIIFSWAQESSDMECAASPKADSDTTGPEKEMLKTK